MPVRVDTGGWCLKQLAAPDVRRATHRVVYAGGVKNLMGGVRIPCCRFAGCMDDGRLAKGVSEEGLKPVRG
jgi:hypothetical protein